MGSVGERVDLLGREPEQQETLSGCGGLGRVADMRRGNFLELLTAGRAERDQLFRSYELGRGSLLDVIAEQRRFIDVESGYTDVLKQVYDAAVEVERAVGVSER